jgi:hypothetical protein
MHVHALNDYYPEPPASALYLLQTDTIMIELLSRMVTTNRV